MTTYSKSIPNCQNIPKPSRSRAVTPLPLWFSALLLITYLLPTWSISAGIAAKSRETLNFEHFCLKLLSIPVCRSFFVDLFFLSIFGNSIFLFFLSISVCRSSIFFIFCRSLFFFCRSFHHFLSIFDLFSRSSIFIFEVFLCRSFLLKKDRQKSLAT